MYPVIAAEVTDPQFPMTYYSDAKGNRIIVNERFTGCGIIGSENNDILDIYPESVGPHIATGKVSEGSCMAGLYGYRRDFQVFISNPANGDPTVSVFTPDDGYWTVQRATRPLYVYFYVANEENRINISYDGPLPCCCVFFEGRNNVVTIKKAKASYSFKSVVSFMEKLGRNLAAPGKS